MSYKNLVLFVCLVFTALASGQSQDSTKTIIAKSGDGIINVLRSHGMNVTKYYERFLELNEGNIRKGSELHIGRTYYLPDAPDSFENMGRKFNLLTKTETAIFSEELFKIRKKDNSLKETVYYMVFDESKTKISSGANSKNDQIARNMAKELLSHGAKVYLIDNAINENSELGEYAAIINRLYLKNNGLYQRLLLMDLNGATNFNSTKITIAHYDKSKEGQKLALNIGNMFQKKNVLKNSSDEYIGVFKDKTNLYLAKNILPAMTFIKIENEASEMENNLSNEKEEISFSNLIFRGIFQDYTNIQFEED